eukprot:scaffold607_cov160-Ochromonas_danica.AAC.15
MGGAVGSVTMHQVNQLPSLIDRNLFTLLTKKAFAKEAYDQFADHEGMITIDRLKEIIVKRDVAFSFEWGIDSQGRSSVRRVQRLTDFLNSKGLFISSDDDQNNFIAQGSFGANKITTRDRIREKMASVQCLLLLLTQRYYEKLVSLPEHDNALKMELDEFLSKHGARRILPCLLESDAQINRERPEPIYTLFHHRLCLDLSNFEKDSSQLDQLYDYIVKSIQPLRLGGDYGKQKLEQEGTSRAFRYQQWLVEHLPAATLTPQEAQHYANILVDERFDSILRLMQVIGRDDSYLLRLGFTESHARLLQVAVKKETLDNFDGIKAATIEKVVYQREGQQHVQQQEERKAIDATLDASIRKEETFSMAAEDDLAYTHIQSSYLQSMKQSHFEDKRLKLQAELSQEREKVLNQIHLFESALQVRKDHEEQQQWHQDILRFLEAESMDDLADAFRILYHQLQENGEMTAEEENSDWKIEVNEVTGALITSSKKHRVQGSSSKSGKMAGAGLSSGKSFSRSSVASMSSLLSSSSSRPMTRYGSNGPSLALTSKTPPLSRNPQELVDILQQAACVLKRIEQLCAQQGIAMVQKAAEQGVARLVALFLAETYIYHSHFLDITLPRQTLSTLSTLCQPAVDEDTLQEQLIFQYHQLGTLPLVMAVLKYHIDDRHVVSEALRCLDSLLLAREPEQAVTYTQSYLKDPGGIILLLVSIEKFEMENLAIVIYSTAILCKLMRATYLNPAGEEVLRRSRYSYILRGMNEVLNKIAPTGGCNLPPYELMAIFRAIEDLYFNPNLSFLPLPLYHAGSVEGLDRSELRQSMMIQVDEHVLMPLLMQQIMIHAENPPVAIPVLRTLGNLFYLRHDHKKRAWSLHFPREMMRILKNCQRAIKSGQSSPEERMSSLRLCAEALLTLANSIDLRPFDDFAKINNGGGNGKDLTGSNQSSSKTISLPSSPSNRRAVLTASQSGSKLITNAGGGEWEKHIQHYLSEGLAEVVCDIFDAFQSCERFLFGLLVLILKMIQQGNTLATQRLVAVGLCDKMTMLLEVYSTSQMSRSLYEITLLILISLALSDDVIINATRRLVDRVSCERWLVRHMRAHCLASQTGGHWSHFYSQSIVACGQHGIAQCTTCIFSAVLACLWCEHPERGASMQKKFLAAGLPNNLHRVPIDNTQAVISNLTAALASSTCSGRSGSGGISRATSNSHLALNPVQEDDEEVDGGEERAAKKPIVDGSEGPQSTYLLSVFPLNPQTKALVEDRSVEYVGNLTTTFFDRTIIKLFALFHVPYGPRTESERSFVAQLHGTA